MNNEQRLMHKINCLCGSQPIDFTTTIKNPEFRSPQHGHSACELSWARCPRHNIIHYSLRRGRQTLSRSAVSNHCWRGNTWHRLEQRVYFHPLPVRATPDVPVSLAMAHRRPLVMDSPLVQYGIVPPERKCYSMAMPRLPPHWWLPICRNLCVALKHLLMLIAPVNAGTPDTTYLPPIYYDRWRCRYSSPPI